MAELWGIPEINDWWLPDGGTCPPVVRSVRSSIGNRLPYAESESRSEDQRNIKGIFSQVSLHGSPKPGLAAYAADAGVDQDMGLDNSLLSQNREGSDDMML